MKIYIAGPMTGIENYNRESFFAMAERLNKFGHVCLNPASNPDGLTHAEYMHLCYAMIDVCDAIVLLPGWENSKGATLEHDRADFLGKKIYQGWKNEVTSKINSDTV